MPGSKYPNPMAAMYRIASGMPAYEFPDDDDLLDDEENEIDGGGEQGYGAKMEENSTTSKKPRSPRLWTPSRTVPPAGPGAAAYG